ncbi:MAG: AmmeMemoRadiSam system radical SAM enzyme [Melioribacteraceae bacterium]|nr:AmmeMemoRadiSam system radical SAM enzyme [Melioribacteraceae bacterium]
MHTLSALLVLAEGQKGFCFIRENIDGTLYSTGYGRPTGFAIDPIEKKPLFHFYPNTEILSFGTAGCNLGCKFCQNWTMSKSKLDEINSVTASPEDVIKLAQKHNVKSIAYTYNDPTIIGEYVIDVSKPARELGIKSVMVTAGYIDKEARKDVYKYIDAANIDLKAFTEDFYHNLTSSKLAPVLDTIKWLKNETDIWIELTTLIIPNKNDSDDEIKLMSDWILENIGDEVPHHFTAFHPTFKMNNHQRTPSATLDRVRNIAMNAGLKYVYVGNVHNPEAETTYCPKCKSPLIERDWHSVNSNKIINGSCFKCKSKIAGIYNT